MTNSSFPEFDRPPVVETVLSVRFREITKLVGARVGQFWDRHLREELPDLQERPPYQAPVERTSGDDAVVLQMQLSGAPPMSRTWLVGGNSLVQIQSDWFAYNWRRTPDEPDYIRYPAARERFGVWLNDLGEFVQQELGRALVPTQCEVTYVNQIELTVEDLAQGPLGAVLRGIVPTNGAFLPVPVQAETTTSYLINSPAGEPVGQLHINAESVRASRESRGVRLVLTARGRPLAEGIEGALAFCDLGREWIVKGFKDCTSEAMWDRWGLKGEHE